MNRKLSALFSTSVLFMLTLLLVTACGESKQEKRWRENRIRDSLATIAELDSVYDANAPYLDTIFSAMDHVKELARDREAFAYEPGNPWNDFDWVMRGFTGVFVPKTSTLKPSEIVFALEFEWAKRSDEISLVVPVNYGGEENKHHPVDALFQVRARRNYGKWTDEARKGEKQDILNFFDRLPQYTHLKIVKSEKYVSPQMAGLEVFEEGSRIKRFFFYDIRKQEIVGHYYVKGENSVIVTGYGRSVNDMDNMLKDDLNENYHKMVLNAANKLTPRLKPPYL